MNWRAAFGSDVLRFSTFSTILDPYSYRQTTPAPHKPHFIAQKLATRKGNFPHFSHIVIALKNIPHIPANSAFNCELLYLLVNIVLRLPRGKLSGTGHAESIVPSHSSSRLLIGR